MGDALATFAGQRKVETRILERWITFLDLRQETGDPVFAPWFAFAALPDQEYALTARDVAFRFDTNNDLALPINAVVAGAFSGVVPASLKEVAAIYGKLFREADMAWTNFQESAREPGVPKTVKEDGQEAIRQVLNAEDAPPILRSEEVRSLIARHLDNVTLKYRQEVAALDWTHPGAPARAMALADLPEPHNSPVFIRGSPGNPGPAAPRQFLEILAGPDRQPFTNGSGRFELARAIASRDNPLTARVFVNRVWAWHFGAGLVSTPSDFGVRTAAPVQQDLLDWLAAAFMDRGWSVKTLHRLIMLSNTYRQSNATDPQVVQADPDNLLLGHFNRRRLDFEAMRDTILAVSGRLEVAAGGQPVDILSSPFSGRRTLYGFIDRQNLPGLFRTFDFANPDASAPQRFTTTVPQQALFMMNSPFVIEQARALAHRAEVQSRTTDLEKIRALYQLLFQREPERDEAELARVFLEQRALPQIIPAIRREEHAEKESRGPSKSEPLPLTVWEQLAQVFLLANELIFVD